MKSLYLECASGISGDMFVAAMLDLGADQRKLMEALESLNLEGYTVRISRVKKAGIDAMDFDVVLSGDEAGLDHDMDYLYGDGSRSSEKDSHHVHRHLSDIFGIIDSSGLPDDAKELSKKIFNILGDAESKAHGVPVEEVHFHEVGAVDSIVDIVSAAVCFTDLGFDNVIIPRICEGQGTVRCAHGVMPVPVPAVVNIAAANHLTLSIMSVFGEYVTPTGAAICAAIKNEDVLPKEFIISKVGIGAGKREHERPGMLRAFSIEPKDVVR